MNKFSRRYFLLAGVAFGLVTACNGRDSGEPKAESKASPKRIVALEWVLVENLLALGIQPIGVADIEGYQKFVNIEPTLAEDVKDVGTRAEPNLEVITQLNPDLILGVKGRHQSIEETLAAIAPTQLFSSTPENRDQTQLEHMKVSFRTIAETINRREKGEAVLEEMEATFTAARDKLSSLNTPLFVLAQFPPSSSPQIRLFANNALAVQALQAIGLENAWDKQQAQYGFNTVWLEALPSIEKANFLYIAHSDNDNWQKVQESSVWQELTFVKENRFYSLGSDTWVFGGPKSTVLLVENTVKALSTDV